MRSLLSSVKMLSLLYTQNQPKEPGFSGRGREDRGKRTINKPDVDFKKKIKLKCTCSSQEKQSPDEILSSQHCKLPAGRDVLAALNSVPSPCKRLWTAAEQWTEEQTIARLGMIIFAELFLASHCRAAFTR